MSNSKRNRQVGVRLIWLIGLKEIQISIPWPTNVRGLDAKPHPAVLLLLFSRTKSENRVDEEVRWCKNVMNFIFGNNLAWKSGTLATLLDLITTICGIQMSHMSSLYSTCLICNIGLFALPPHGGCENNIWLVNVKIFWSKQNEDNGGTLLGINQVTRAVVTAFL